MYFVKLTAVLLGLAACTGAVMIVAADKQEKQPNPYVYITETEYVSDPALQAENDRLLAEVKRLTTLAAEPCQCDPCTCRGREISVPVCVDGACKPPAATTTRSPALPRAASRYVLQRVPVYGRFGRVRWYETRRVPVSGNSALAACGSCR